MQEEEKLVRISWKEGIGDKCCRYCKEELKFAHATSGKDVYCLDGVYHQIVNLYHCPDPQCKGAKEYVNPSPRLDYSIRYYGADVFRFVAKAVLQFKLKTAQIHRMLRDKQVEISESTVREMVKDVLVLKSDAIDHKTAEIVTEQGKILLALDGQQPDNGTKSLWLFVDLLSNRVLHTQLLDKASYENIHKIIERIVDKYQVNLVGVVSDKQGNLVKCMETYYPDVPHQYCAWHFTNNIWKHLEMVDNRVHMAVKKQIKGSILYTTPQEYHITVDVQGTKEPASKVFGPVKKDLKRLTKKRTIKFETLHGIVLCQELKEFCDGVETILPDLPQGIQLTNILEREIQKFRKILKKVQEHMEQADEALTLFKTMYTLLYETNQDPTQLEEQLAEHFDTVWKLAQTYGMQKKREDLKSILPSSKHTIEIYYAEQVRLWDRYREGLFQYQHFPHDVRTNVFIEQLFSKEVCYIIGQKCKRRIGFVIETQGEYLLRILHATEEELEADILESFSQERLHRLRDELQEKISEKTSEWVNLSDLTTSIRYLKRTYGIVDTTTPFTK